MENKNLPGSNDQEHLIMVIYCMGGVIYQFFT